MTNTKREPRTAKTTRAIRKSRDTDKNGFNRDAPFILRFDKITPQSSPEDIRHRVKLLRSMLNQAVDQPNSEPGRKLRETATVEFHFDLLQSGDPVVKKVQTSQASRVEIGDDGIPRRVGGASRQVAWKATVDRVRDILRSMITYSKFADRIMDCSDDVSLDLPEEHPSEHFTTFVKHLFEKKYRVGYERILTARREAALAAAEAIRDAAAAFELPSAPFTEVTEDTVGDTVETERVTQTCIEDDINAVVESIDAQLGVAAS